MRCQADEARAQLAQDLNRLEYRLEAMKDWHVWFRYYPGAFLGTAFAGAFFIGYAFWPRTRPKPRAGRAGGIMRED